MPVVDKMKWGEDNPIENAPELTEEEKDALAQRMAAMDKILADTGKAKYKIELFLSQARSVWKPTRGIMTFWESGTKFHGGGDTSMKLCPGYKLKGNGCRAFIHDSQIGLGHCVCPACGTVWRGEMVEEAYGPANHTMRTWADVLYRYFRQLNHNCDIYLKHAPTDIRSAAHQEVQWKSQDALQKVRSTRALHIYPLANIIKDTASGSDILTRFHAFLTA